MRTIFLFPFIGCLAVLMYCVQAAHYIFSLLPEKSGGQAHGPIDNPPI